MANKSEYVKKWRRETKQRIIDAMGGKCQICGYSRCINALELHHIDPSKKEICFGTIRANPKQWNKIVEELRKCVLLCAVCHREIHAGFVELPIDYKTFDETYSNYKETKYLSECPICNKLKPKFNKFCSLRCSGKNKQKVDWESVDLYNLIHVQKKTLVSIAEGLNVSDVAVKKRAVKLGIIKIN